VQLECALFITVVVGMACAIIAALSSLFWHSPDLKPHEKLLSCSQTGSASRRRRQFRDDASIISSR
jgi:hypothetical protein